MNFIPRYYQQDACDATAKYLVDNPGKHPLIICPTGSGKSYIIAMLALLNSTNTLVVSHVKEILEQDTEALELLVGDVGVYSAGIGRRDTTKRATVCGLQSIYNKPDLFQDVNFIIVDEAHMIPKSGDGMYMQLFKSYPNATIIGLTATGYRLGTGYLHKGEGKLFDDIVYEIDIVRLIKEGYLSPLLTKNANEKLDTKKLKLIAGDFSEGEMAKRFDKFGTTNKIVSELSVYREIYKHWLVFAISIEHATHLYDALLTAGIKAGLVHSKLNKADNEYTLWAYKRGLIQAIVSVNKITTGFDSPHTDLIALVRPTNSPVLHVQMIGRGLRTSKETNKEHCLILDFSGNLDRLGPINDVHVREPGKKGSGESPIKACPECNTHVPAGARKCYVCGYEFPQLESRNLTSSATSSQAIKDKEKKSDGVWLEVTHVDYIAHTNKKGLPSLQVRYRCGLRAVSEYIAIGREGLGGDRADTWWYKTTAWATHPEYRKPKTVTQALVRARKGELRTPKTIYVKEENGYPNIKCRIFD